MAATPVGATTAIRLRGDALIWCKKVVLPVPALPVRKMFLSVWLTYSNASSSWGLDCKLMVFFSCRVPAVQVDQDRKIRIKDR